MANVVVGDYHIGYPDLDGLGCSFLAVCTQSDSGDGTFKVYCGMVALPDPASPDYQATRKIAAQRIASRGQPERYERAITFFPSLEREKYRP